LDAQGHKVCVLPRELGVPGHSRSVLQRGLGGPVDQKTKSTRGPGGFGWALGGRGVNSQLDSQIEELWIYG
jgi:hypothetical protein